MARVDMERCEVVSGGGNNISPAETEIDADPGE